ncbi:MAG: DUF6675 family protein [Treponema sp.]|uniref:DUF6675 family protein n=1 Tax=Treponema sp. TaxID=166 RepID=UPI003FA22DCE
MYVNRFFAATRRFGLNAALPAPRKAGLGGSLFGAFCAVFFVLCIMLGAEENAVPLRESGIPLQETGEDTRVVFPALKIQDEGASVLVPVYELKELFPEAVADELLKTGRIQRSFYGESNVKLELCPSTDLCRSAVSVWNKQNEPVFIVESLYLLKKTPGMPNGALQDKTQDGTESVPHDGAKGLLLQSGVQIVASEDADEFDKICSILSNLSDMQVGVQAGGEIGKISSVLRNLSTMQGIQYYSNSRKRWETLYTEVYTVNNPDERTKIADPTDKKADGLVSYVYQKDRSLSGCVYKFSYFEQAAQTSFRAENTEKIIYKGFNILKPEAMLLCLNAVETEEHIVFYITVRADAAKIPLVSERLAKSYGSRADAIYNWCVSKYSEE